MEGPHINELSGLGLSAAVHKILNPRIDDYRGNHCLAAVARSVLKIEDKEKKNILDHAVTKNPNRICCYRLSCHKSRRGTFIVEKDGDLNSDDIKIPNNGELLNVLCVGHDSGLNEKNPEEMVNSIPTSRPSYYAYNVDLRKYYTGYLEKDELISKSHISVKMHSGVLDLPGINYSYFYISGVGAFGEIHVEDADLASFNLVYFNLPEGTQNRPSKLWLIVRDEQELIRLFQRLLRPPDTGTERSQKFERDCLHVLHHKDIFLTVNFLRKHGIEFDLFFQYPGDLVYIKRGVFHQVVNLTPNFAEAIDYADALWLEITKHLVYCNCFENATSYIKTNDSITVQARYRSEKLHHCSESSCKWSTKAKSRLIVHMKEAHSIRTPLPEWHCGICNKTVKSHKASIHRRSASHRRKQSNYSLNISLLSLS
ncbi:hypothetical protein QAD02_002181 [Eretmocerus hayati]|uniref:Uncharacterized protein n=1 Tax=Eretmocerus hayati TaxID=131215 RepID=A0ACC2NIK7_9HYME|nr:hypothetical protein QAD02_002181 [Eretmocerus hayati]